MSDNNQSTWYLKLVSVLMAVLLWFFVVNENAVISKKHLTGIKLNAINLGSGLSASYPDEVSVTIVGTPRTEEDIYAYVDLKGKSAGVYTLPVKVKPMPGTRVSEIEPAQIRVEISEIQEFIFPVTYRVTKEPAAGYEVIGVELSPNKCIVQGRQSVVNRIASLSADLELSGLTNTASLKVELVPLDKEGQPVESQVNITPSTVRAYVVVGKNIQFLTATVKPELNGQPAEGYRVESVVANPVEVSILTDQETAAGTVVSTEPIELDKRTSSFQQEVALVAPQGTKVYPTKVIVTIEIKNIEKNP